MSTKKVSSQSDNSIELMRTLIQSGKNIIIEGDIFENISHIENLCKELGIMSFCYTDTVIKIDTAKEIRSYTHEAQENRTVILIAGLTFTNEAQGVFLKTLEEHSELITVCIIVPTKQTLERTIISRSVTVQGLQGGSGDGKALAELDNTNRLTFPPLVALMTSLEDEEPFAKLRILILLFEAYRHSFNTHAEDRNKSKVFTDLYELLQNASLPGSSLKQVIQTFVLTLP